MEITYKRKHNESFMVMDLKCKRAGHESKMIENNDINALLPMKVLEIDGACQCWYDISKKESLRDYLDGEELNEERLEKLLFYLNMSLEEIEKYLIDSSHILLNADTVFLEKSADCFRIYLCYAPETQESIQIQFRTIMEYILGLIRGEQSEFVELAYEMYDRTTKDDYTFSELLEMFHVDKTETKDEIYVEKVELEEDEDQYMANDMLESDFLNDYYDNSPAEGFTEKLKIIFSNIFKKRKDTEKKEGLFEDFIIDPSVEIGEPTILLTEDNTKVLGKLMYDGNDIEDNFVINQPVFRIGSESGNNHGVIHSKAVSRHHAKIRKEGEGYYLSDTNSTNGTYINGHILEYKQEIKLKAMDNITFGDTHYVFI